MNINVFDRRRCILGEGPLWTQNRLFWVDITDASILSRSVDEEKATVWKYSDRPSALSCIQEDNDSLLVAFEKGIYIVDIHTGNRTLIQELSGPSGNRSNDGGAGPDGSFWIGTMDDAEEKKSGELLRYDGATLLTELSGIGISNTVVWSPDSQFFYFADSMEQVIWRFRFEQGKGLSEREEFVSLRGTDIYPDGSAIDQKGYLWNAQWDGGRIVRYDCDGSIDRIVELPVSRPTCCAFGGGNRDVLFVTSASIGCDFEEEPLAGATFMIEGVTSGIPEEYSCII
jgi:L-arabinonolactonase